MTRALTNNNWTANTAIGALEKSNDEFIHATRRETVAIAMATASGIPIERRL